MFLVNPEGKRVVVELKSHPMETGLGLMRKAVDKLERARSYLGADFAVLLLNRAIPPLVRQQYSAGREWLNILDVRDVDVTIRNHPAVQELASALVQAALQSIDVAASRRLRNASPLRAERAQELLIRLAEVPTGRDGWRGFEDVVVEILSFVFTPSLGIPTQQTRSDDGLDIRDAIFPIKRDHWFWNELRVSCRTRFLVVESKNREEAPGQREVESLQQYLYTKAMRTVGLLVARLPPTRTALLARRRAWVESDKMILFLSIDDLAELVLARERGEDAEELLDAQLDAFLATLVA